MHQLVPRASLGRKWVVSPLYRAAEGVWERFGRKALHGLRSPGHIPKVVSAECPLETRKEVWLEGLEEGRP